MSSRTFFSVDLFHRARPVLDESVGTASDGSWARKNPQISRLHSARTLNSVPLFNQLRHRTNSYRYRGLFNFAVGTVDSYRQTQEVATVSLQIFVTCAVSGHFCLQSQHPVMNSDAHGRSTWSPGVASRSASSRSPSAMVRCSPTSACLSRDQSSASPASIMRACANRLSGGWLADPITRSSGCGCRPRRRCCENAPSRGGWAGTHADGWRPMTCCNSSRPVNLTYPGIIVVGRGGSSLVSCLPCLTLHMRSASSIPAVKVWLRASIQIAASCPGDLAATSFMMWSLLTPTRVLQSSKCGGGFCRSGSAEMPQPSDTTLGLAVQFSMIQRRKLGIGVPTLIPSSWIAPRWRMWR